MAGGESTTQLVVRELTDAVKTIQDRFADGPAFQRWMADLGWVVPAPQGNALADLNASITLLLDALNQIDPEQPIEDQASEYADLLFRLPAFIKAIRNVNTVFAGVQVPNGFAQAAPKQIADDVVITHLEVNHPALFGFMRLFGLITVVPTAAQGQERPAFVARDLRLDRIGQLLSDPVGQLRNLYQWGTDSFDAELFFSVLQGFAHAFGIPARAIHPQPETARQLYSGLGQDERNRLRALHIPVYQVADPETGFAEVGVGILPIMHDVLVNNARPVRGLALQPFVRGVAAMDIPLGGPFRLVLTGALDVDLLIEIRQNGVTLRASDGTGNRVDFDAAAKIALIASGDGRPLILFGEEGKTRLQMTSASVSLGVVSSDGDFEVTTEFELRDLRFILSTAGGDGFISKIMPVSPMEIELDLVIGWSSSRGVYFRGSAALEVTIPVHKKLGPVTFESIFLRVEVGGATIPVTLAVTGSAELGPISASVDRIGLIANLSFPADGDGDIGPMNVDFEFKPPNGVGLQLNAEAISGGGFLLIDRENERYAGMLSLKLGEIGLTAIGLITTRMPDGSKGFSLLAIIAVTFDPAITLGYGFFLKGVGGLLGLNRTMRLDVIEAGVRNGALDAIMFPEDPGANAPRYISDLEAVFPAARDRLVIGPMVMITWGVPTIITAELAILIEVPSPVRIAILGQISIVLPKPQAAIIELRLDVAGLIDFGKRTFGMDASLRNSHILSLPISGDAAMRLKWGDDADFALAVGGWHALYTPPRGFPSLRRLRISLGSGKNPRLELDSYFALSPNTVQFGARLALEARAGDFSLEGGFSFDVLFIFSPFSFSAEMKAGVSVKAGSRRLMSIRLEGLLEGPSPWHVYGRASFEVCWVEVSVKVDKTFGKKKEADLPDIDLWTPLKAALAERGNWSTALAPGTKLYVVLRENTPADFLLAAPIGEVTIRQRVVPLGERITKAGNAEPPSPVTFDVTATAPGFAVDAKREPFAMSNFQRRSDNQRLTGTPFESVKAGVTISGDALRVGPPVARDVTFEEIVLDDAGRKRVIRVIPLDRLHARAAVAISAAIKFPGDVERRFRNELPRPAVQTAPGAWQIVNTANLAPVAAGGLAGSFSQGTARALLDQHLADHPWEAGQYQVMHQSEVLVP